MTVRYTNIDGLTQQYGTKDAQNHLVRSHRTAGAVGQLVIDFSWDNLPSFDEGVAQSASMTRFSEQQAFLPAGAWIKSATLLVQSAMTGTTGTLTIGTYQKDGTVIDADGIDAAVAQATLVNNAVVEADGAQVAGSANIGANDAYIVATTGGTVTGGEFRLVIEYVLSA